MAAADIGQMVPESDTEGEEDGQNQDPNTVRKETNEFEESNVARPCTRARPSAVHDEGAASSATKTSQKLPHKRKAPHPEEESKVAVQKLNDVFKQDHHVTIHCNSAEWGGRADISEYTWDFHLEHVKYNSIAEIVETVKQFFKLPRVAVKILKAASKEAAKLEDLTENKLHEHFVLSINNKVDFGPHFRSFKETIPSLPHQDLHSTLAKGSYTLPIALCELIDNSVQATSSNEKARKREISIFFKLVGDSLVRISDNGNGWDMPSEFSSLGYGTHQRERADNEPPAQTTLLRDHFCGNISRYGVGGKFAEALLGDQYTLDTKTRGDIGHSVTYGKSMHLQFEKETWSALAKGHATEESFSTISVREVDLALFEQCQRECRGLAGAWYEILAKNLRKIYFAYIQLRREDDGPAQMGVMLMVERWEKLLTATKAWPEVKGAKKRKKVEAQSVRTGSAAVDAAYVTLLDQLKRAKESKDKRTAINTLVGVDLNIQLAPGSDGAEEEGAEDARIKVEVGGPRVRCRWDFIFGEMASDCFPFCVDITNPDFPNRTSTVRVFVTYFGHRGPAAMTLAKALEEDKSVDGSRNLNRAGYFWNGRYLPNEQLELEFMRPASAPRKLQKALERCYARTFAVVLLDRNFQVQLNKQALDQNSAMYTALQEEMKKEEVIKAFVKYLQNCNSAHDDEVNFSPNADGKRPVFDENTHKTTHYQALIEHTHYNANDKVAFWKKGESGDEKNERSGTIVEFQQDGEEEGGGLTGVVLIRELVGQSMYLDVDAKRLNLVSLRKLTKTTFEAKQKELAKTLPVSLEWERPREVCVGDRLKALSVRCLSTVKDRKGQLMEVPAANLSKYHVTLKVTDKAADAPTRVYPLELKRETGKFMLESGVLQEGDTDTPLLTKVGTYTFLFLLSHNESPGPIFSLVGEEWQPWVLPQEEHEVEVISDGISKMELTNEAVLSQALHVGQEIPALRFNLLDLYDNTVSMHGRTLAVDGVPVISGGGDVDWSRAKVKEVDGQCEVKGLKLKSGPMGEWKLKVSIVFDHVRTGNVSTEIRIRVDHGSPVSIERVMEPGAEDFVTNLQPCPPLEFELKDESGNVCANFDGWAMLTCPALPPPGRVRCRVAQGRASFESPAAPLTSPLYSYATGPPGLTPPSAKKDTRRRSCRANASSSRNPSLEFEVVKPKNKRVDGIFLGDSEFFVPGDTVMIHVQSSSDEPAVLRSIGANCVFELERFASGDDGEVRRLADSEALRPAADGESVIRGRAFLFGSAAQFEETLAECRGKHVFWTADAGLDAATAAAVPFDVFLFQSAQKQPERCDFEGVLLHSRALIPIRASRQPVAASVVRECRESGEGGKVFLSVGGLLQGKPRSKLTKLLVQVADETGAVLPARSVTRGALMALSWGAPGDQELTYSDDGQHILLPVLEVSDTHAREQCTVTLRLSDGPELVVEWVVSTDAGEPDTLRLKTNDKCEVCKDMSFQLTVADSRGSELAPQEAGQDWELEILDMVVFSNGESSEFPVQVRKESYGSTQQNYGQAYTTEAKPVAKPYGNHGNQFFVEHVRLLGTKGPVRISVTAKLTITGAAAGSGADDMADHDDTQVYKLTGSMVATLEPGDAQRLVGRGYDTSLSTIHLSTKSHALVERIIVDFVDACDNRIADPNRTVNLVLDGPAAKRACSAKGSLELAKYDGGYMIDDLRFSKPGVFEGVIRGKSLELKVEFEVATSDRVVQVRPVEVVDTDVEVGGWATVRVILDCEDGSFMPESPEHSVSVFSSHDGFNLESKPSHAAPFDQNVLTLSVKMPLAFPENQPEISLGATYAGPDGGEIHSPQDAPAVLPLRSGPLSRLTVARLGAGAMSVRATQATQSSQCAPQPVLDEATRSLSIPDLQLTACDAHGNACNTFEETTVAVELRMDSERGEVDLELQGVTSLQLSPDENPRRVQGLSAKLLHDVGIEKNYDFAIEFAVTPARGIASCAQELSYYENKSTQEKIARLETEESFRQTNVEELDKAIKTTKQKIRELKVAESEEVREEQKRSLLASMRDKSAEIERRKEEERGEEAESCINLPASHAPRGLIGLVQCMVSVSPGPRAPAIREALSKCCGIRLAAALFESDEALEEYKASEEEQRRCKLRYVYAVPRLSSAKPAGYDAKKTEGYVGLLSDFAQVDERKVAGKSEQEAVRKLLRMICGSTVLFETYRHAIDHSRKMAQQSKPAKRAVGLDRPCEVIDADGGQDLAGAHSKPAVRLAIRSFADSPECTQLRQAVHAAREEIDLLESRLEEYKKLRLQLEKEEEDRAKFAGELDEVQRQLEEARRHAERQ